jgi:hypothetical protein
MELDENNKKNKKIKKNSIVNLKNSKEELN